MSANAKINNLLKSLRLLNDYNRERRLQVLAEECGEGFAAAVRKEFERQQREQGTKR
ncbi:hypothetical protein [Rhodopseudomonas palustris]|uniref:hypothetical protein n=1 Tax=Rhodopseudomonas palustris TaxID=1076 RepID=UPI0014033B4F|nr:hypothetical protein [Rhodopseudomonas palustris]